MTSPAPSKTPAKAGLPADKEALLPIKPSNFLRQNAPDASVERENPACGDVLRISLRREGERIAEIRFLAQGCVAAVACASALTELVQGRTLAEARLLRREDVALAVGGLRAESNHASQLAVETLRAALERLA